MKLLGRLFLFALALLLAAAYILHAPFGPSTGTFVDIAPNTSTPAIAAQLKQSGIIRSRYAFDLIRLVHGGRLHAGEYRFDHPIPLIEVYRRLRRGDVYTRALTIPEGYNIFDIAQAVETAGLGTRADILAAEHQHLDLIAQWAPQATSLEGYLFPATYHFSRHASPAQILTAMVRRFRQTALQLSLNDDTAVANTITMASLIEKEVSQDAERPIVAGVFHNRLERGMPLQTDPAVVYAALLEDRYRGTIYLSDLQSPSPYNTYRHTGLPPGPICNPGLAALKAAINPAQTDFLYFVSDNAGHTRFSVDLAHHQQQVATYRKDLQAQTRGSVPVPADIQSTHRATQSGRASPRARTSP